MKCPSCSTNLEEYSCDKATIDICPSCNGMWFDRNEMRSFVEFILRENKIPDAKIETGRQVTNIYRLNETVRNCPRCDKPMVKNNYAYDSNIFIDRCTSCDGIWTDGKEIYEIAVHVKGNPALEALGKAIAADQDENSANGLKETLGVLNIIGDILLASRRRKNRQ